MSRTSISNDGPASSGDLRPQASEGRRLPLRPVGALLGGSFSALAAAFSYWFGLYWWNLGGGLIALLGIVVGTAVGFAAGPVAATTARPVLFACGVALKAVFIGLALLIAWSMVASLGVGGWSIDAGAILFGPILVLGALLLALPVTVPVALLAVAVQRLGRNRPRIAGLAVAATFLASAALTAAVMQNADVRPDWGTGMAAENSPVELEWTVANHSRDDLILSVSTPSDGSVGGWSRGLPACFTTTGRSGEADGWFLDVERETDYDWEATPRGVVSSTQVPGSNPRVWIDVGPGGTVTVFPGRAAPPAEQLIVDLCLASVSS